MERNFMEMLRSRWAEGKFLCVGLDTDIRKVPPVLRHDATSLFGMVRAFNGGIINATKDIVCAYKPNIAFYEDSGEEGLRVLRWTVDRINEVAPGVPVILDCKRGDIGRTNEGYVNMAFTYCRADAVTVSPYLGRDSLRPFLDRAEKGIIVLCRTSNPGAGEFQDLTINIGYGEEAEYIKEHTDIQWENGSGYNIPLFAHVAYRVSQHWNQNGNCALVVGATTPHEMRKVRSIVGDMPILAPGIGTQGGDLEATLKAGLNSKGQGLIVNASSSVIFASSWNDWSKAAGNEALRLHIAIDDFRKEFANA